MCQNIICDWKSDIYIVLQMTIKTMNNKHDEDIIRSVIIRLFLIFNIVGFIFRRGWCARLWVSPNCLSPSNKNENYYIKHRYIYISVTIIKQFLFYSRFFVFFFLFLYFTFRVPSLPSYAYRNQRGYRINTTWNKNKNLDWTNHLDMQLIFHHRKFLAQ